MKTETLFVFPEDAKGNSWLKRFEEQGILHGFISRDRASFLGVESLLHDKYRPLIFHSHFVSYDISTVLLKLLFHRHAKVVWHLHSRGTLNVLQRGKDLVKVRVIARSFVDRLIAVSEGVFDHSRARGFESEKLVVVHNGIEVNRFRPNQEVRERIRASLGITGDEAVYLLLGWDPHTKGVDLFAKAAHRVAGSGARAGLFLIIGEARTREFMTNLPEAVRLGVTLRVIDPVQDFAAFLNAVDVVVSASRSEGLPYAILEGMAAGKLILSSDIPGVRETYGGSRGVGLFPPADWMMLATCMKNASDLSIVERRVLGDANSRYVAQHYSLTAWADQIADVYEALLH